MIDTLLLVQYMVNRGVTPDDAQTFMCIAYHESKMKPKAINKYNSNGTKDYGFFQINEIWIKQCNTSITKLLDIRHNTDCAIHVYNKQGLTAWATYRKCV